MRAFKTARAPVFTRPANTTAYANGDLVANNTTAGSVVALAFGVAGAGGQGGKVTRVIIAKSTTNLTNASFNLHLYAKAPTVTNGDNGAIAANGYASNYLGVAAVTVDKAQADGALGYADVTIPFQCEPGVVEIYGLLEATAAYTPGNAETIKVAIAVERSQL